jgi:hypothetical protein
LSNRNATAQQKKSSTVKIRGLQRNWERGVQYYKKVDSTYFRGQTLNFQFQPGIRWNWKYWLGIPLEICLGPKGIF